MDTVTLRIGTSDPDTIDAVVDAFTDFANGTLKEVLSKCDPLVEVEVFDSLGMHVWC